MHHPFLVQFLKKTPFLPSMDSVGYFKYAASNFTNNQTNRIDKKTKNYINMLHVAQLNKDKEKKRRQWLEKKRRRDQLEAEDRALMNMNDDDRVLKKKKNFFEGRPTNYNIASKENTKDNVFSEDAEF